jgi:homoserine dehydrogenase
LQKHKVAAAQRLEHGATARAGKPTRSRKREGEQAVQPVERFQLTTEHTKNYVLSSFREETMFRAVVEEAAALTSISLFLGMIAIWAQVIAAM